MAEDDIPSPAGISFIGALAVVVFYWLHLVSVGAGIGETGVEITLFISAFLAQYIPLASLRSEMRASGGM